MSTQLQAQNVTQAVHNYFDAVRTHSPTSEFEKIIYKDGKNLKKVLKVLEEYTVDSTYNIRGKAYYMAKLIALMSDNLKERQDAVELLVKGIGDADSGVSGGAIRALTQFDKNDFNKGAKEEIAKLKSTNATPVDELIKLAGYLELQQTLLEMNRITSGKAKASMKWAAYLAMARMGDSDAIGFIYDKLTKTSVNDNLVYDIVPDIVYTRDRKLFDFLITIINSDQPGCNSANPDASQKILCAYRVMEYVTPAIVDFPIKVDTYGEPIIEDYENALILVREWFLTNDRYKINKDSF
jgi:hypothetical protein